MKIAFISTVHGHKWPGSEYLWADCAGSLLASGQQAGAWVSQDCAGAAKLTRLTEQGLAVNYISRGQSRWTRLQSRLSNPYKSVTSFAPDFIVVSAGSAYDPVYAPGLAAFLCETAIPFVFVCHFNAETFWVDEPMRVMMRKVLDRAAASVFVAEENHRLTVRQLAMKIPRVTIIPPPLSVNLPAPLPWPERSPDSPWRMACVARLEPRWKGQDVLFEILAGPQWKDRNWALTLFGDGSEAEYLKRLSSFYGLDSRVTFGGYSAPLDIWKTHHLQVLATRGEAGPMVIPEGMMCGRAAVTTRCGSNMDYIIDDVDGFLADFATTGCFGARLNEAWERRDSWKQMGLHAHTATCQKRHMGNFSAPESLMGLIGNLSRRGAPAPGTVASETSSLPVSR